MNKISGTFQKLFFPLNLIALSLGSMPAMATLGEREDSLERDRTALMARQKNVSTEHNCKVQEIESDATNIKEYLTSDGVVFAVTWRGMRHPDLSKLLGGYFADYQQASDQKEKMRGRRSRLVRGSRIVVETSGQMRGLRGRAYDPNLVPSEVNINEIK